MVGLPCMPGMPDLGGFFGFMLSSRHCTACMNHVLAHRSIDRSIDQATASGDRSKEVLDGSVYVPRTV